MPLREREKRPVRAASAVSRGGARVVSGVARAVSGGAALATVHGWELATAAAAVAFVAYRTLAAISVGPRWDAFAFLANAAAIAGKGYGYTEPARAPLISVLSAGPLLAFGLDQRVIQVTDAALTLVGLLGLWLLVRRRLTREAASVATLALLASPALWEWVGVGYTDVAAVGLCAWALLLFVKATEEDSRWYLAAFPLLLAAVLMRTSALLFGSTVAVWLLMRARPFRHARHIGEGVALAVLAYVPFAWAYVRLVGDPLYPFVASRAIQEAGSGPGVVRQVASFATSLHTLAAPRDVAALTVIALLLAVEGLAWGAWRALRRGRPGTRRIVAAVVVGVSSVAVVRAAGPLAGQLAIALGVFSVWRLLAAEEVDSDAGYYREVPQRVALDAAMLVWLLSFWWFHEEWAQKVARYYITMAPGVVYFTALGWRELVRRTFDVSAKSPSGGRGATRLAGAGALVLVAVSLAINVGSTSWQADPGLEAARDTARWIASAASSDAGVYSDEWPMTAWYLKRDVEAMPLFADEAAVSHELAKNRADFFVSNDTRFVRRYRDAYASGPLRVLVPDSDAIALFAAETEGILYLGAGWENYLEELDGYHVRLEHHEGDYNVEGTVYLETCADAARDAVDALAVYGVRWRQRGEAQRALEEFVAEGGTLLIDASHNLDEPFSLNGSVLFDTVISRELVPRDARIAAEPTLFADLWRAGSTEIAAAPFVDENGGPWYGAGYRELPGSAPMRVLARLNGRPLVAEREWGEGRVVWVGYNLFWHAHVTGNADEARIVRAVLDEVLGRRPVVLGSQDAAAASSSRL